MQSNRQRGNRVVELGLGLVLAWGLTQGLACGGEAGDPSDESDPGPARMAETLCAKQDSCCPAATKTKEECLRGNLGVFTPIFELGGIEVDQEAFQDCLSRIEALTCDEAASYGGYPPVLGWCDFYRGTLADGEDCDAPSTGDLAHDLAFGLFEDDRCASGSCEDGKCVALPGQDEPCAGGKCGAGLRCSAGHCVSEISEDGSCAAASGACAEGLVCAGEDGAETCRQPTVVQVGEECASGTVCVLGDGECSCPKGQEGCSRGVCGGDRSRCLAE